MPADRFDRRQKELPAIDIDAFGDPLQRGLGIDQIAVLAGQLFKSAFKLFQLVERFEIDCADIVDLVAKLGDFPFDQRRA